MKIRRSGPGDLKDIRALHKSAFGPDEGKSVAQLSSNLLQDATAKPYLSLVAEKEGDIVGNVIFSNAQLKAHHEVDVKILVPVAVYKEHQQQGIATKLISYGLDELREQAIDIVFVYGEPDFYAHFGFHNEHNIAPPYDLSEPDAWQALELTKGMLNRFETSLVCPSSLAAPEYW